MLPLGKLGTSLISALQNPRFQTFYEAVSFNGNVKEKTGMLPTRNRTSPPAAEIGKRNVCSGKTDIPVEY